MKNLIPLFIMSSFISCTPAHADDLCTASNDSGGKIVLLLSDGQKGYTYSPDGKAMAFDWIYNKDLQQVVAVYRDGDLRVYPVGIFTCPETQQKNNKKKS